MWFEVKNTLLILRNFKYVDFFLNDIVYLIVDLNIFMNCFLWEDLTNNVQLMVINETLNLFCNKIILLITITMNKNYVIKFWKSWVYFENLIS